MKFMSVLAVGLAAFLIGGATVSVVFSQSESEKAQPAEDLGLVFVPMNEGTVTVAANSNKGQVPVRTFLDADWGTLAYVTDNGISAIPFPEVFEVRVLNLGDFAEVIRFSPLSGDTWRFDQEGLVWVPMPETESDVRLNGNFDVELHYHPDAPDEPAITYLRFDRLRGDGWVFTEDRWQRIGEVDPEELESEEGEGK